MNRLGSKRKLLNIAVVGCGHISEEHLKAWKNLNANIVAVCDTNIYLARSKAEKWKIPRFYEDVSKLIEMEDLDAVSVCTPPNVRLSVIKPIVEKGVHVVVEKPFAMTIEEAKRIVELKDKYGVKVTVVHNWLFSHIMERVLKYLRKGYVGEIASVEISMYHTSRDPMAADPSHWCHKIPAGRFGENLPHPIYIIRAILGDVSVRHIIGSKLGSYQWMPIDELKVLLEDGKGRLATIHISFNAHRPETILNIVGDKGAIYANLSNNILIKKGYRDISMRDIAIDNLKTITDIVSSSFLITTAIITGQYKGMHTNFMKKFAESILNNTQPPVSAEEALKVVELHAELTSKIHELYFNKEIT
ncbi:MAG: Gfo/Idh/MocA family oxidoreductase [Thermosphaera sp.]